jgi:hypothetical protein
MNAKYGDRGNTLFVGAAEYSKKQQHSLGWDHYKYGMEPKDDMDAYFKIEKKSNGNYLIRSMKNGRYLYASKQILDKKEDKPKRQVFIWNPEQRK